MLYLTRDSQGHYALWQNKPHWNRFTGQEPGDGWWDAPGDDGYGVPAPNTTFRLEPGEGPVEVELTRKGETPHEETL